MSLYLQLSEHLIGQQLLPQVVSTLDDDRQQPPVEQVTIRRRFSDPPEDKRTALLQQLRPRPLLLLTHSPHFLLPGFFEGDGRRVLGVPPKSGGSVSEVLRQTAPEIRPGAQSWTMIDEQSTVSVSTVSVSLSSVSSGHVLT